MLKDALVYLTANDHPDAGASFALSLASRFPVHLVGLSFAYDPVVPPSVFGAVPMELVALQKQESTRAAEAAVESFKTALRAAALTGDSLVLDSTVAAAGRTFGQCARLFDLSVVTQADPDSLGAEDLVIEGALFESGRPVLLVPFVHKAPFALDRVLVAWDGSRTVARACGDALPFLTRAKRVEVVTVAESGLTREMPIGTDIAQHLARHDVKVEVKQIADGGGIAETLLSYAADAGADLLVMGGYGRSRLREFVLGGTTRGILEAMTLPVLMSH